MAVSDILALITARGGSKGVPRKNVRPLAGKPLLAWSAAAALNAQTPLKLVLSTDDPEIAAAGLASGAEVPFLRPAELASDTATSEAAVRHTLDWLAEHEGYRPRLILLLQPTSPFRTSGDIDRALALQREKDADSVVSVTDNERPPQWLRRIGEDGLLKEIGSTPYITRRQESEKLYRFNGAIYVIKTEVFLEECTFYPKNMVPYLMPAERSLDIDSELDFLIADLLMTHRMQEKRG
ncbi:acylneuraminate cytidylyltransferase family protein [Geomonas subterranea]|uniref:acylneuraminate cytidylyltransferase family protein n=1 Tax=Geomonas subterranea TaxID=2847989 RepID=UPI001CD406DD|nr:acylneuraminate cytidylyltransferase family protein [Geomonas fuzhouensis]